MAIEVPQNNKISRARKNREKESVRLFVKEERLGGTYTLCSLVRCWPLHNQSRGQANKEK